MGLFGKREKSPDTEISGLEAALSFASVVCHVSRFWESKQGDIRKIGEEIGDDFKRQPGKLLTILESAAAAFDGTVLDYQIEQVEERLGIEDKKNRRFDGAEEKRRRLEELVGRERKQFSR
jgi:hypothetical protein